MIMTYNVWFLGNPINFVFPRFLMFSSTSYRETSGQNSLENKTVPRDLTMYREAQPGHIVISFFIFHFSIFDFNFLIFTSPFSFSVDISVFIFLLFRFGF